MNSSYRRLKGVPWQTSMSRTVDEMELLEYIELAFTVQPPSDFNIGIRTLVWNKMYNSQENNTWNVPSQIKN